MPTKALAKSYEAQRQALIKSTQAQQDQAQAGYQSTQAQYQNAYQTSANKYNQAYNQSKNQYEQAYQNALSDYQSKESNVVEQAEKVAQEAYLQKMNTMKVAPNILQNAGLSGQGYAESTLAGIQNQYQNTWSDVMQEKNKSVSEIDRLRGLAGTEKQYGLSQAETEKQFGLSQSEAERQFGLSQAQAQLQQNMLGIKGTEGAGLLNIEAQYQADLANYLAQVQAQAAAASRSSGGGSTKGSSSVKGSAADVENGLKMIRFDPRTNDFTAINEYLQKNIDAGVIGVSQAEAMKNRLFSKYQPSTQSTAPKTSTTSKPKVSNSNQNYKDFAAQQSFIVPTKRSTRQFRR